MTDEASEPEISIEPPTKLCIDCGSRIPLSSIICPVCGAYPC